jgi:acyl-CoA dehydrogenase
VDADFDLYRLTDEHEAVRDAVQAVCADKVARACASTSLIPAVNKLGTMPLLLAGSEEIKARYLPPVAAGEALSSTGVRFPATGSSVNRVRV